MATKTRQTTTSKQIEDNTANLDSGNDTEYVPKLPRGKRIDKSFHVLTKTRRTSCLKFVRICEASAECG